MGGAGRFFKIWLEQRKPQPKVSPFARQTAHRSNRNHEVRKRATEEAEWVDIMILVFLLVLFDAWPQQHQHAAISIQQRAIRGVSPSGPPELALHGSQASPTEDEPARKSKYDKWSHIEQQCLLRLGADQMTDVREQMACHVRLKFTLTNLRASGCGFRYFASSPFVDPILSAHKLMICRC